MEAELGGYSRDNKDLNRQLEHMEIKVRVTQRDIMKERQQVRNLVMEDLMCAQARVIQVPD